MPGYTADTREDVVRNIIALLIPEKYPFNIPLKDLLMRYRQEEGELIPHKELGYSSLVDFLRTVPELEVVSHNGAACINFLGSSRSKHVSELVARQKTTPHNRSRSGTRRRIPPGYITTKIDPSVFAFDPLKFILTYLEDHPSGVTKSRLINKIRSKRPGVYFDMAAFDKHLDELGNRVEVRDNLLFLATPQDCPWNDQEFIEESKKMVKPVKLDFEAMNGNDYCDEGEFDYVGAGEPSPLQSCIIEDLPIISRNSTYPEENNNYEQHCGDGKHNQQAIPSNTVNGQMESNDYGNARAQLKTPEYEKNGENGAQNDETPHEEPLINDRVRFRLEKLIQDYPEGVWCADLAKLYFQQYKLTLDWADYDFNSLSDMVQSLPSIFHSVQPHPHSDFMVYPASRRNEALKTPKVPVPTLASVYKIYADPDDDVLAIPRQLPPETINQLIPRDVLPLGETIGQVSLTEFGTQKTKGMDEVIVCEAFTPYFFWIHLRKKTRKMNKMVEELQAFYNENYRRYEVPLIFLEKGLNVVARFYGIWTRGIVKAIEPDVESTTAVLFYDYGTVHKYPAKELCFLQRKFTVLPAQAIPCALAHVRPSKANAVVDPKGQERWSIEASRVFVQKVHEVPMIGTVEEYCYENNSLLLNLIDTSSDDDVDIAAWLVESGWAQTGERDIVIDINNLNLYTEDYDFQNTPKELAEPNGICNCKSDNNSMALMPNILEKVLNKLEMKDAELKMKDAELKEKDAELKDIQKRNGEIEKCLLHRDVLLEILFKYQKSQIDLSLDDFTAVLDAEKSITEDKENFLRKFDSFWSSIEPLLEAQFQRSCRSSVKSCRIFENDVNGLGFSRNKRKFIDDNSMSLPISGRSDYGSQNGDAFDEDDDVSTGSDQTLAESEFSALHGGFSMKNQSTRSEISERTCLISDGSSGTLADAESTLSADKSQNSGISKSSRYSSTTRVISDISEDTSYFGLPFSKKREESIEQIKRLVEFSEDEEIRRIARDLLKRLDRSAGLSLPDTNPFKSDLLSLNTSTEENSKSVNESLPPAMPAPIFTPAPTPPPIPARRKKVDTAKSTDVTDDDSRNSKGTSIKMTRNSQDSIDLPRVSNGFDYNLDNDLNGAVSNGDDLQLDDNIIEDSRRIYLIDKNLRQSVLENADVHENYLEGANNNLQNTKENVDVNKKKSNDTDFSRNNSENRKKSPRNLRKPFTLISQSQKAIENDSTNSEENSKSLKIKRRPDYIEVQLTKAMVTIFLIDKESFLTEAGRIGWITTEQFRVAFTDLEDEAPLLTYLWKTKIGQDYNIVEKDNNVELFNFIKAIAGHASSVISAGEAYVLLPLSHILLNILTAFRIIYSDDERQMRMRHWKDLQNPMLRDCCKLFIYYDEAVGSEHVGKTSDSLRI